MADGKWVMTEEDARRVDLSFNKSEPLDLRGLPNYGQSKAVDDRSGGAKCICAFCGSSEMQTGFGGFGEGFGYRSFKCRDCGGTTNFVYKDDSEKFFRE